MAVVQSKANQGGGATVNLTLASAPTTGNLLVAWVTCFNGFASVGAGWTDSGITRTDANSGVCKVLYRYVTAGLSSALNFGVSNNTSFWGCSVVELDRMTGTWATDLENSQVGSSTSSSFSTTSFNSANADDIALIGVQCAQGSTLHGGFDGTWTEGGTPASGGAYTVGNASKVITNSGDPVSCTMTWTHGFTATYIVLAFKQTALIVPSNPRTTLEYLPILFTKDSPVRTTLEYLPLLFNKRSSGRTTMQYVVVLRKGVARRRRIFPSITQTVSSPLIPPLG